MTSLPRFNEQDLSLLVRYSLESDEEMAEAVATAFVAVGIEVFSRPTTLVNWINADVFERLQWTSDRPLSCPHEFGTIAW